MSNILLLLLNKEVQNTNQKFLFCSTFRDFYAHLRKMSPIYIYTCSYKHFSLIADVLIVYICHLIFFFFLKQIYFIFMLRLYF